jgi:hypothetical protein
LGLAKTGLKLNGKNDDIQNLSNYFSCLEKHPLSLAICNKFLTRKKIEIVVIQRLFVSCNVFSSNVVFSDFYLTTYVKF